MDEFIIRITDDFAAGIDAATGGGEKKGGSAVSLGGKIGAGIAIANKLLETVSGAVNALLNPIMGILKGIFRFIGEMFRPISDIIVTLLKPVLILLKPFLDLLRSFIAPFMDIAREYGRLAQEQMRSGNVATAMSLSLDAANAVLGPFIISLASVALQLASTLLITGIGKLLAEVAGIFSDKAKQTILNISDNVITDTNDKITGATMGILDSMLETAQRRLDEAKSTIPDAYNEAMIETPAGLIAEMAKYVEKNSQSMDNSLTQGMNSMDLSVLDTFDTTKGSATTTFKSGLDAITSAVRVFASKVEAYADNINSIRLRAPQTEDNESRGVSISAGFNISVR